MWGRFHSYQLVLAIISGLFLGCRRDTPPSLIGNRPAGSGLRTEFSFNTDIFEFESLKSAKTIRVAVRYKAGSRDDGHSAALQRAFTFRSPETTWLLVYLQHQALQWLNGHPVPDGLSIEIVAGDSAQEGRPWWITEWHDGQFSPATLALRDGDAVLAFLPDALPQPNDWTPLTPESYEHWYRDLDARLRLNDLFRPTP